MKIKKLDYDEYEDIIKNLSDVLWRYAYKDFVLFDEKRIIEEIEEVIDILVNADTETIY